MNQQTYASLIKLREWHQNEMLRFLQAVELCNAGNEMAHPCEYYENAAEFHRQSHLAVQEVVNEITQALQAQKNIPS